MKDKKATQLGMNPSTASGRLIKDLLWNFIVNAGVDKCYHCGENMSRETFSVEHKNPWLDSDEPVTMFFDLGNIAYSHISCNIKAARKPTKLNLSPEQFRERDRVRQKKKWDSFSKEEQQEIRKQKYLKHGK